MRFEVDGHVFDAFEGMRIVTVVAAGIDNSAAPECRDDLLLSAWKRAAPEATAFGNAQSHPRVKPWRQRFKALGVSGQKFPSSIESLLRRAGKGGAPPRINALVDRYNAVSLEHVVPVGAFDIDRLKGQLRLRRTEGGERFIALDKAAPEKVSAGEIAYADDGDVLTRHLVWRQSRAALVDETTTHALVLSEVLGELPRT